MSDTEETPAETIHRLERANNHLAQMLKRGSDRLSESARELMAQGWDKGWLHSYSLERGGSVDDHSTQIPKHLAEDLPRWNPYRQPAETLGETK